MGYNYQGEDLERELHELRRNDEIKSLCEAVSSIKIVEGHTERIEKDQKFVRILSEEEAGAIEKERSCSEPSSANIASVGDQIVFEPK